MNFNYKFIEVESKGYRTYELRNMIKNVLFYQVKQYEIHE